MAKTKTKKIRTRPNFAQRDFWNSTEGIGGGQWGDGFIVGVRAFVKYLNRRQAVIELNRKKK